MWERIGVLSIIDLGQDYYLVTFTSEEDQTFVLQAGPWLIYDNYLTLSEWSPNFYPLSDYDFISNIMINGFSHSSKIG